MQSICLADLAKAKVLLGERNYDRDPLRATLDERSDWTCVKPMTHRVHIPAFSEYLYRYRNLVERLLAAQARQRHRHQR